jgi:hypothetical protein
MMVPISLDVCCAARGDNYTVDGVPTLVAARGRGICLYIPPDHPHAHTVHIGCNCFSLPKDHKPLVQRIQNDSNLNYLS